MGREGKSGEEERRSKGQEKEGVERERDGVRVKRQKCTNLRMVQPMMENQREKPKCKQYCYSFGSQKYPQGGARIQWNEYRSRSQTGLPMGSTPMDPDSSLFLSYLVSSFVPWR